MNPLCDLGVISVSKGDGAKALECFTEAADSGCHIALYYIGYLYEEGLGVEQSTEKAIELYHLAAEGGSEEAQNQLLLLGE